MSWFSVFKSQPHHEGRTYNDANKLGRELTPKEAEENGEIFLLDAIKSMPHVEKRGNTVLLDPDWLKGMQPSNGLYGQEWYQGDRVFGFSFDFRDIHKEQLCIEYYYQRKDKNIEFNDARIDNDVERIGDFLKNRMCIHHRRVPDNVEGDDDFSQVDYKRTATPADDYAAFCYLTSNRGIFNNLWNTAPVTDTANSKEKQYDRIVYEYKYKRLSDGRLQQIRYEDLSSREKRKMETALIEAGYNVRSLPVRNFIIQIFNIQERFGGDIA